MSFTDAGAGSIKTKQCSVFSYVCFSEALVVLVVADLD